MVFYHVVRHELDVARSEQASRDGIPRTFLPCFIAFCSTIKILLFIFFSLLVYTSLYNPILHTNLNKCIIVIRKVFWLHQMEELILSLCES